MKKDNSVTKQFWKLWDCLSDRFQRGTIYEYADKILLNYLYWTGEERDWEPLRNKAIFFVPIIPHLTEFSSLAKLLAGIGFKEMVPAGLFGYQVHLIKLIGKMKI